MKTTMSVAASVLLIVAPLLASSSDASAYARHRMKRMSHARTIRGDGSSIVSVGSDVRISGSGEVIVPQTAIIAVHRLPPTVPPEATPSKPVSPAPAPAQP